LGTPDKVQKDLVVEGDWVLIFWGQTKGGSALGIRKGTSIPPVIKATHQRQTGRGGLVAKAISVTYNLYQGDGKLGLVPARRWWGWIREVVNRRLVQLRRWYLEVPYGAEEPLKPVYVGTPSRESE